jgi:hypothetical protein
VRGGRLWAAFNDVKGRPSQGRDTVIQRYQFVMLFEVVKELDNIEVIKSYNNFQTISKERVRV